MKRSFFTFLFIQLVMNSCQIHTKLALMKKSDFNAVIDDKAVGLYTLCNKNGMTLQITNFGCRVVSLFTKDKNGKYDDIVLGYNNIDRYIHNTGSRFLGAIIGRYANRIANGHFEIKGHEYQLIRNSNGHCLHGGDKGFDMVVWNVDSVSKNKIVFSYLSKDMEEGFPGNLNVRISYTLTNDNELRIDYKAITDKDTPINLSNHSFFNLKGQGNGMIYSNILCIAASKYVPIDTAMIPLGKFDDVEGTPFNFIRPVMIGNRLDESNVQIKLSKGYDHSFVINRKTNNDIEFAVSIYEPSNGRYMEVWTTEPGIQFFSGNFFDGKTMGKQEKYYKYREAFALETQHFPDSPNQKNFPSTILHPGEIYTQTSIYKFGVKY